MESQGAVPIVALPPSETIWDSPERGVALGNALPEINTQHLRPSQRRPPGRHLRMGIAFNTGRAWWLSWIQLRPGMQ